MKDISTIDKKYKISLVIAFISIGIALAAIILSLISLCCEHKSNLSVDDIVSYMGLLFSIVGVVATIYFVILSYRARLIRDDLNNEKQRVEHDIREAKEQWKEMVNSALNVIYQNYSFIIRDNPSKMANYKLQQSRLASKLKLLDSSDRLEKIELLGTINRQKMMPEWNEIDDDIKLLKQVLFDKDESAEIKNKALESINTLEKLKK